MEFPINPVLAVRSPSYSLAADSLNMMRMSSRHYQSYTIRDKDQVQTARDTEREANNSNSGRLKTVAFKLVPGFKSNFTTRVIH